MKSGGSFKPGHQPTHDVAAAGRKNKRSPWRKAVMLTPNSARLREQWAKESVSTQRRSAHGRASHLVS